MDVYCTLSLVDFSVLTGDQRYLQKRCRPPSPWSCRPRLPSPWYRVAFVCKLRPPRFAVEPRCRIYFLRLTFVAFQSRQTPSITRPRSLLAAHDVHQGSRRKIGPRGNQRPPPNLSRRCVRWTNPSWAGLELCFCSVSLLASV